MRKNHFVLLSVFSLLLSVSAFADHGSDDNGKSNNSNNGNNGGGLSVPIIGSQPSTTVGGIASGGAPWVVREGSASVSANGKIQVEVQGLLIGTGTNVPATAVGTVGSVRQIAASLVCGGSGGTVAASTAGFPLSAIGNASFETALAVPARCSAPVVLLRVFTATNAPGTELGPFIAISGLGGSSNASTNGRDGNGNDDRSGPYYE